MPFRRVLIDDVCTAKQRIDPDYRAARLVDHVRVAYRVHVGTTRRIRNGHTYEQTRASRLTARLGCLN